jgi:integrase
MPVRRAKTLEEADIIEALEYVKSHSAMKERDTLLVLLSCRLGLRAQEIAYLWVEDITNARGKVREDALFVSARGAKYGKARSLPMRADVRAALINYIDTYPRVAGPMFFNQYGDEMESTAVQKQLKRIYGAIGLQGCSSHSGRRTFGTAIARFAAENGGSIVDPQKLLGHSRAGTTEAYVDVLPSHVALVNMLGTVRSEKKVEPRTRRDAPERSARVQRAA